MIVKRNMIDTKFGGPKDQQILCSSDYNTPKKFRQYYRNGANEDPWLSYKHHGTESMMYGENGMFRYIYYFIAVARSKLCIHNCFVQVTMVTRRMSRRME